MRSSCASARCRHCASARRDCHEWPLHPAWGRAIRGQAFTPVTDAMLLNPDPGRLAQLAPDARRLGLQPAQANHDSRTSIKSSSRGRGRWRRASASRRRSCRTARCSCRARAAAPRRSTPRTATCSGNIAPGRPTTARRAPRRCETSRSTPTRSTSPRPTRGSSRLNARTGAVGVGPSGRRPEARLHLFRADRSSVKG